MELIESVEPTGKEVDRLRFMIETKTETITLVEIKAMVYVVMREKN